MCGSSSLGSLWIRHRPFNTSEGHGFKPWPFASSSNASSGFLWKNSVGYHLPHRDRGGHPGGFPSMRASFTCSAKARDPAWISWTTKAVQGRGFCPHFSFSFFITQFPSGSTFRINKVLLNWIELNSTSLFYLCKMSHLPVLHASSCPSHTFINNKKGE